MEEPTRLPGEEVKRRYWRSNLRWLAGLLGVWLVVSYGCGIILADWLDQFRLPGTSMKLGFWFAQQGSIYVFVVLIAIYARVMNRLDRELFHGTTTTGGEES